MRESFGELEDAYKSLSLAVSKDGARSDWSLFRVPSLWKFKGDSGPYEVL